MWQPPCFYQSSLNLIWIITVLRSASKLRWWLVLHPSLWREHRGSRSISNLNDQIESEMAPLSSLFCIFVLFFSKIKFNRSTFTTTMKPFCHFCTLLLTGNANTLATGFIVVPAIYCISCLCFHICRKQSLWLSDQRLFLSHCCPSTPPRHLMALQFTVTSFWTCS